MDPVLADHRPDALADAVLRRGVGTIYAFQSSGRSTSSSDSTRRGPRQRLIYYIYESLQIDNNAGRRLSLHRLVRHHLSLTL